MDEVELEVYGGSLAAAWRGGMPLDPTQLPIIVHLRGSYVMGLLVTPIYGLFGGSLWALKVLAVTWSLGTLALLFLSFRAVLGDVAALAGGLAYVFLPPSFQMVDILLLGSHGETILFIGAGLLFVVTRQAESVSRLRNTCCFGALLGLGFLFSMQFLAVIPALVIAWWARAAQLGEGPLVIRKSMTVAVPGFGAAGLYLMFVAPGLSETVPMWWQFALVGLVLLGISVRVPGLRLLAVPGAFHLFAAPTPWLTRSTDIVNQSLESRILPEGIGAFFSKLWHAMAVEFPDSWLFDPFGGPVAKWLFGIVMTLAFVVTLRRALQWDPLAIFLVLHPIGFFILYAATDLEIRTNIPLDGMGSRYLMPVLASVTGWFAILVHEALAHGRRPLAWGFAAAPVCAGILGLLPLMQPSIAFGQPTPRGSRLHYFNDHFAFAGGEDLEQRLAWIERIDPDWAAFRPGYYTSAIFLPPPEEAPAESFLNALQETTATPEPLRNYLLFYLGYRAMEARLLADPVVRDATRSLVTLEELPWFARGLGAANMGSSMLRSAQGRASDEAVTVDFQFLRKMSPLWRGYAAQGAGFAAGALLTPFNQVPMDSMLLAEQGLRGADRDNFFIGLALGYRTHYIEETWWVPEPGALRVENMLGADARAAFRRGLMEPVDVYPKPDVALDLVGN